MSHRDAARGRTPERFCAVLATLALLALPQTSDAGLTLVSSAAQVSYSLNSTTPNSSGPPVFNANNILITPGSGLPTLLFGEQAPGTFQIAGASTLSPGFAFRSSTTPQSGATGTVPAKFGTAVTALFAQGTGQQGTLLTQGGLFYDTRTRLTDNLSATDVNLASLSFTFSIATFRNDTGADIVINPAALLSVQGTLGSGSTSYVAAGLVASVSLSGVANPIDLKPIVLAASQSNVTVSQNGTGSRDASSTAIVNGQFYGTATSSYSGTVTIRNGQSISIQSRLTLISDPGSSIRIVSDLAPLPGGLQFKQPDFGVYVGGDFSTLTAPVPEPSTIVMLGLGLATVGGWRLRARRHRTTQA
ncbi:PEP-CTERM sorting domain-containing protein [Tundrisphaera lichenicola]|uniref:PEP-CTERM sorting domain-containing protein n=1 Tax=Tundrisphaera lichenicola TaxID=2029860 RepID=UPI003EBB3E34